MESPLLPRLSIANSFYHTEEFALLEVAYTVARLVQIFPTIHVTPAEAAVEVGQEKQTLTLVVASAEGCVVSLKSSV